ncbi:MAG TPA: PAM68 family protein [Leptolyngbya sp.]|jgi:hypothetical protein|nr:PAM68 family protein [Leptolyngbya sp.]
MSDNAPDPTPERLPFEPGRKKAKAAKPAPEPANTPAKEAKPTFIEKRPKATSKSPVAEARSRESAAIPDVVSKRMARRMAFFCGLPTVLGISTFVVSYFIVTQGIYNLPTSAVVLVSMLFLGLGVVGLSYGLLSASWDEERTGGWVGASEFTTNVGRLARGWKEAREQQKQKSSGN